jgi:hypothetical protein
MRRTGGGRRSRDHNSRRFGPTGKACVVVMAAQNDQHLRSLSVLDGTQRNEQHACLLLSVRPRVESRSTTRAVSRADVAGAFRFDTSRMSNETLPGPGEQPAARSAHTLRATLRPVSMTSQAIDLMELPTPRFAEPLRAMDAALFHS